MTKESVKLDILFLLLYLEKLQEGGIYTSDLSAMCEWAVDKFDQLSKYEDYVSFYKYLFELIEKAETEKITQSKKVQKALTSFMKKLLPIFLNKIELELFVTPQAKQARLPFRSGLQIHNLNTNWNIPDAAESGENLRVLVSDQDESVQSSVLEQMDLCFSVQDMLEHALQCYPVNDFTYDRLFLSAKLQALEKKQDTKIWVAGSSYAMVGVVEKRLPKPALNSATNAQDPYYSILSVKTALNACASIETIIMSVAYYFFFTNIADQPSDYMHLILSRVNYPVFQDRHGFQGDLLPLYPEAEVNPIYDAVSSTAEVRELIYRELSQDFEDLPFFNSYRKRPEGGMLTYRFIEKTDEQNFRAAGIRAQGHNKSYHLKRGEQNAELFDSFLQEMEELGKQVVLFVPPATDFYQKSILPEMRESFYRLFQPVLDKHSCTFIDLFSSPEFVRTDFQDYDHLNSQGAEKLTKLLSGYCTGK